MKTAMSASMVAFGVALSASTGLAEELNVVCSNEQAWCDLMAQNFEIETGIDVAIVRKSTGEVLAQLRAEKGNPKVDVWWGGTGDPHIIAANEGLTTASGVDLSGTVGWAQNMAEMTKGRTVGVHVGLLGMIYNTELLAEKGLTAPACWRDLAKPEYKGEIQVANPNSSGTAYTELATLVQLFGEEEGFQLLADIGRNVNQYTKSGSAPSKATARGETTIGIGFIHDMVSLKKAGFPVTIVSPCEGTGYELGAVSIVDGANNLEAAKRWVEYVISAEAQDAALQVGIYTIPSNPNAKTDSDAPDMNSVKLIDYDFMTYGATKTRTRLLDRWTAEVKNAGGAIEE
ncbi:extracellular solute-binding protein [Sinorhizobium medicae]|uniref:ABC transporter substrate-binding protein n=1 Tax=Sinorhizobium medicae TaxID=110321 RepID=UPI00129622F2|nr:ABC transporter substrate-binding protein [Sinorhizobium medicae]MQV97120.1 extracellular solute-binding protein [Sinorhizobium medicae]